MKRADVEQIILSVLENPAFTEPAKQAAMAASLLMTAYSAVVEEDPDVILVGRRKMRVTGQNGPVIHMEAVDGSGVREMALVDDLVRRGVSTQTIARALDAAEKKT